MNRFMIFTLFIALSTSTVFAGTGYEVASQGDEETITYEVNFGGGRMFQQYTAYDPASKSFVYLSWKRGEEAPKPVYSIWDHASGRTIDLYQFPKVEHPLPVIPSIKEMKICPKTGGKIIKATAVIAYD